MAMETRYNSDEALCQIGDKNRSMRTSCVTDFKCFPSPCHNSGGSARAPSPYSFTKTVLTGVFGEERYEQWGKISLGGGELSSWQLVKTLATGCFGLYYSDMYPNVTLDALAQNTAYNKALSKLYDGIRNSEIGLNTSVGEGRETLEMLHSIAKKFKDNRYRTLFEETRKLSRALKKDRTDVLASGWLGWAVGWKPFLSDLQNIFNHFTSLQTQPHMDFVGVVKARGSSLYERRYADYDGTEHSQSHSYRVEFGCKYRVTDLTLFNEWQLGLNIRPTLVWELTMLSFVVDYFVGIGQYLAALEAGIMNNGFQILDGYKTTSYRVSDTVTKTGTWASAPNPGENVYNGIRTVSRDLHCSKTITHKSRELVYSAPVPILPTFKIPKASEPILTMTALLSTLIPRNPSDRKKVIK